MKIKEQTKELWKTCFDDTDEFVKMYFHLRYKNELNYYSAEDGRIVSALQLIPYPMTCYGKTERMVYVSGACTHPDYRNKGLMREVLNQSLFTMHIRKIPFVTLIPAEEWLFDYYQTFGFQTVFKRSVTDVEVPALPVDRGIEVTAQKSFDPEAYRYYAGKLEQKPCCVQHTENDFKVILKDLFIGGDKFLVARRNGQVKGLAFVVRDESKVTIKELLAEDKKTRDALLGKAAQLFNCNKLSVVNDKSSKSGDKKPIGMIRVADVGYAMGLYAAEHPDQKLYYHVVDKNLFFTQGHCHLEEGKCDWKLELPRLFCGARPGIVYKEIDIRDVASLIFERQAPYMNMMLD